MSQDQAAINYDELREKLLGLTLERKRLERDLELEAAVSNEKQTIRKALAPLALSRGKQNVASLESKNQTIGMSVDCKHVLKESQNSKVAFGSSVPPKSIANNKQISRKTAPVQSQSRAGRKIGQVVQSEKIFERTKQVVDRVGDLTRASCQAALQGAGGALAIAKDESQTAEKGVEAACLAAYAGRLLTLLSYPDELCRRACKAADLSPAADTLAEAMRIMLDIELDARLPTMSVVLALVSTSSVFVTGKKVPESIREALKSLPQTAPDLSSLRVTLLECIQSWSSCRSLPFREAAMMTTRTCLERLHHRRTMSEVEMVVAAAVLVTSFNLARHQPLTANRAGFCVAILSAWQNDAVLGVMNEVSSSSSSSSTSAKTRKKEVEAVERSASFAVMAAIDDLWRRVREAYDAPVVTPVKVNENPGETVLENPLLECANEFNGELRHMLVKAANRLSDLVRMLLKDRISRMETNLDRVLKAVETGYFEVRKKITSKAPVDVALDALERKEQPVVITTKTRASHGAETRDLVEARPASVEEEKGNGLLESQAGVIVSVERLKKQTILDEGEDEDQASDEASPRVPARRVRPITQRAPISASPPARPQPTARPTIAPGVGLSKQRLFDDWTSESSSSWLSETGELSPDEVRAFSSHLNDARSVAARYGIFQTTHPEDVGRLLEPLPFSTRY